MRAKAGLSIMLAGVIVALFGAAVMAVLGPDGRIMSGPHRVKTDGVAVVTAPPALSWAGVRIGVLAEVPVNKPVFVGLGNSLDVENYLAKTSRHQIDSYHTPWNVRTRDILGEVENLPSAPTALDWWLAQSAGLGGASISTRLPDETVSLAILAIGSSNLTGLRVSVAYEIRGGFALGAGLVLLGVAGALFGRMYRAGRSPWVDGNTADDEGPIDGDDQYGAEEESVEYVYVDADGTEHVVDADELVGYEVVDADEDDNGGRR